MDPEVRLGIEAIRSDRVHGAGWLSRRAISVLALAAARSRADEVPALLKEVRAVAHELASARPSMTPIRNSVYHLLNLLQEEAGWRPYGPVHLRMWAQVAARRLILKSRSATRRAAKRAADFISDGDVVITCSYSTAVIKTLQVAKTQGKAFTVLAARSESKDGRAYGEATAQKLTRSGIEAQVVPDNALEDWTGKATKALMGADTVLPDGAIINGAPTLSLAQAAKRRHIPFYVVCETNKFADRDYEPELEEGFQIVPAKLIEGIVTETGLR